MIKKDVFDELGGFDEKFFVSFEDVDLGWRAWIMGYKVMLVPSSVVIHSGGKTVSSIRKLIQFHGTKNTIMLKLTNFELIYACKSIFVLLFAVFLRRFLNYKLIPDNEDISPLPSTTIIIKAICWVIRNFNYVRKKRKLISRSRKISTNSLILLNLITKF
jgi:hypothetical protein